MTGARRRVAVVGSGISGLATAWHLADAAEVVLYEADRHFGGHAHTVDVTLDGVTHGVDTGFLVFNHATYPELVRLFADLRVDTAAAEMSFSVQVPRDDGATGLEWSGCNLDTVFAQRRNLASPRFLGMLRDLLRFNRLATAIATRNEEAALQQPIGDFLVEHGFGVAFRDWYLLPM
jgi:predicted NAD/FAD-binding protein